MRYMTRKILKYPVETIVDIRDGLRDEATREGCMSQGDFEVAAEIMTRLLCWDDSERAG